MASAKGEQASKKAFFLATFTELAEPEQPNVDRRSRENPKHYLYATFGLRRVTIVYPG